MGNSTSREVIENLGPVEEGFTDEQLDKIFDYFDGNEDGMLYPNESGVLPVTLLSALVPPLLFVVPFYFCGKNLLRPKR